MWSYSSVSVQQRKGYSFGALRLLSGTDTIPASLRHAFVHVQHMLMGSGLAYISMPLQGLPCHVPVPRGN